MARAPMDRDLTIIVTPADDWETYSTTWSKAMKQYYWYQDNPVFDDTSGNRVYLFRLNGNGLSLANQGEKEKNRQTTG